MGLVDLILAVYSQRMARRRQVFLIALALLTASTYAAEGDIYRSKDAHGAPVFSDVPSTGAQKIDLRPATIVPAPAPSAPAPAAPAGPNGPGVMYELVAIASPADGDTVHAAEGPVQVSVTVQPPLRTQAGHRVTLDFDGKPVGLPKADTMFVIKDVERGEHTLQAFVLGRDGKPLAQSTPITFYMYQHSKLFAPPPQIPQVKPSK